MYAVINMHGVKLCIVMHRIENKSMYGVEEVDRRYFFSHFHNTKSPDENAKW